MKNREHLRPVDRRVLEERDAALAEQLLLARRFTSSSQAWEDDQGYGYLARCASDCWVLVRPVSEHDDMRGRAMPVGSAIQFRELDPRKTRCPGEFPSEALEAYQADSGK
jgi:hypothetical protein